MTPLAKNFPKVQLDLFFLIKFSMNLGYDLCVCLSVS